VAETLPLLLLQGGWQHLILEMMVEMVADLQAVEAVVRARQEQTVRERPVVLEETAQPHP
jgi:hypothetical protein